MYTAIFKHKILNFVHAVHLSVSSDSQKAAIASLTPLTGWSLLYSVFCEVQTGSSNTIGMGSRLQVAE
jgi:hypothetical protein